MRITTPSIESVAKQRDPRERATKTLWTVLLLSGCAPSTELPPRAASESRPSPAPGEVAAAAGSPAPTNDDGGDGDDRTEVTLLRGAQVAMNAVARGDRIMLREAKGTGPRIELALTTNAAGTILLVKNPFSRYLRYEAQVVSQDGRRFHTSTCAVFPHGSGMESWPPEAFASFVLRDFHLVDELGRCE